MRILLWVVVLPAKVLHLKFAILERPKKGTCRKREEKFIVSGKISVACLLKVSYLLKIQAACYKQHNLKPLRTIFTIF
jgi:hypothetical protein